MATRTADTIADRKKPRLIALIPVRSPSRGATAKIPMIAVMTPMAGTISGNTSPWKPNAALPRISAATSVTAYDSNRSAAMPAQADGDHAGDPAGAEGEPHRGAGAHVAGRRRHPDVAAHSQPHPDEAGEGGEAGANDKGDRSAPANPAGLRRQQQ